MANKLHTETSGSGDDLVLLHGWVVCSSGVWDSLIKFLAKKYRVTSIDLPGFGHSSFLGKNYDLKSIAEQVLEVAPKNAIWLGWSLGGLIATWIAIHAPQRVSKLITVACTPRFIEDINWPGLPNKISHQFGLTRKIAHYHNMSLLKFLLVKIFAHVEYRRLAAYCVKGLLRYGWLRLTIFKKSFNLIRNTDLREHCKKLSCPVLKIFGQSDFLIPASGISAIKSLLPQAKIVVMEGSSHAPFLSQQALFLQIVDEFLNPKVDHAPDLAYNFGVNSEIVVSKEGRRERLAE